MSASQVHSHILSAFECHNLTSFDYCDVMQGHLVISLQQKQDGVIVTNRRDALYIREKVDKVASLLSIKITFSLCSYSLM